jgi:20S proteasome alpha/beta subunit
MALKIIPIKKSNIQPVSYAMVGAGNAYHVKELGEQISAQIGDRLLDNTELKTQIHEILLDTYKKHNVERSKSLGKSELQEQYFSAPSILGARLEDGSFGLYLLNSDPWVSTIDDYEILGSGSSFAELVMRQFNRAFAPSEITISDLPYGLAMGFITHVINEVKEIDIASGGLTQVAIIDKTGFREIPQREITEKYNMFLQSLTDAFIDMNKARSQDNKGNSMP